MSEEVVGSIPQEIIKFFRENVGEILLIKGPPGSGKTLLGLELMRVLCKRQRGIAILTRMDSDQLNAEIPWLMDEDVHNIKAFNQNDKIADSNWFKREFQTKLEESKEQPIGFILLDPIDAFTEQYENPERKIKEIITLVQSTNVSAIMIQDREETTYLDHMAGGVLTIHFNDFEGIRYRSIHIDKLRSIEVENSRYLMTLHTGVFRAFSPWSLSDMEKSPWVPVDDSETHFSTGLYDFDNILKGGYKKGSYNILEVDDNITYDEYMLLLRPILLNFLYHDYGVLMVPPAGEHPENLRADLENSIDIRRLDEKLFFLDYFSSSPSKPYIIPMGATKKEGAQQRGLDVISRLRGKEGKPYLDFVGLDTMEYLRGESITLRHLLSGVSKTKVTKTLGIGLAKPGLKIGQGIKNMSDVYVRMVKIHSIPCIYGIKPETSLYALMPHPEFGYPNLEIVPLT